MNFVTKEPINKGWSSDKKYCVTDENGTRYLLRISDIAQHETGRFFWSAYVPTYRVWHL